MAFHSMADKLPPEIKIAKEASIAMGGSAIGGFFRYLFNVLVARFLGVEVLGFYAISISVTQVAAAVGRLGLDGGVVRFVSRLEALGRIPEATATIRQAIIYGLLSGLAIASVLVLGAERISTDIFHVQDPFLARMLTWFALMIPLVVLAQIMAGASQAFKVLKYPALSLHILPAVFLCLAFPMLAWWASPFGTIAVAFIGSQVVSVGTALFFLMRLVPVHRKTAQPPDPGLLRFSIPLVLAAVMTILIHSSDIIMLGILTDTQTAGLYLPAIRTAGMMALFTYAFSGILAPIVSEFDARNDKPRILSLLRLVGRWNFAITWPAFLFLFLYASKVMNLFGADFLAVWRVLQVLALAQVIMSLGMSSALVLVMTGYPKTALANNTITLVVNVLANLYLIPRYGAMGAALGTMAAMATLTVLRLVELWALQRMHPFTLQYTKPLLAGVAALAVCSLANRIIFDWHTVSVLFFGVAVFVTVYVAALYLLRLDETDLEVLAAMRRKLQRGML